MLLFRSAGKCGYATLKDIQLRLRSIQNIGKITKSMKMIASTKLSKAQKTMETGRFFGQCALGFIRSLDIPPHDESPKSDPGPPSLVVVCSSDRGLCGSIHSSLSKAARKIARDQPYQIAIVGDKAKPQIMREARSSIICNFSQVAKGELGGNEVAAVVRQLLDRVSEADTSDWIRVLYNRFQTVISFATHSHWLPPSAAIRQSKGFSVYAEEEPMSEELLSNYREFALASLVFWALAEGQASEMASRRMAMENATKNSEGIVQALTMRFNRTRQAVITNELVDIITGASAL